ncbi:MAG: PilZ domain-containing protein [Halieaceae bacterium]|jgi:hypothetical protein|nr:PilZ domain-containing protein [Halieaceae bacterium]
MVDDAMPNKRRAQRVHFFSGGELRQAQNSAAVTVVDISLGGVLVGLSEGSDEWQLDADATVSVRLNDTGLEMVFDGVIRRAEPSLLGIEFTEMDIDTATHLRRLLELNTGKPAYADRHWDQLGKGD